MRKISLLLLAMLISAMALSAAPKPTLGSTGNIYINVPAYGPSPEVVVQAGGTIKLYFDGVTFSGGQVRLYFSRDGSSSLSPDDKPYGPTFIVAHIRAGAIDSTTYPGYKVGQDTIEGAIPKEYAGGEWYIKAFDGQTAAVAVTDRPLTVTLLLEVTPTSGPGQAAITLKVWGASTASGNYVNLSYYIGATKTEIINFLAIDANGQCTYSYIAPDLAKYLASGEQAITTSNVEFKAEEKVGYSDTVLFAEYWRGLIQVKGPTENRVAAAGFLFGHDTDFSSGALIVNAKVLGPLIIAGNYFHPGAVAIKWDGTTVVGTTTANGTGFFNVTITVPITSVGSHKITIDDTKIKFNITVNVVPTVVLTPNKGVPCENVQVTAEGYGFTASTADKKYNVTVTWYYIDWGLSQPMVLIEKLQVNTNGYWKFTFTLPHAHGGENQVVAVEDDPAGTYAYAIFTVLPGVKITPSEFSNDGETIVKITGCGLKYEYWYDLLIDSKDFYTADQYGWYCILAATL
ncbi:MAG: hypothetical protein QXX08_10350 [Candidatus Bathyarchaeia archaeon]